MFKKIIAFVIISIIILTVISVNIVFAVSPNNLVEMRSQIYSFISNNLNAHNTSFVLTLTGDFIKNINIDNEPYFTSDTPFNRFR